MTNDPRPDPASDELKLRTETLFHAARTRPAGAARAAFLDGACGADAALRARVDSLLAASAEASSFLEEPAVARTQEGPGSTIGSYKLLQAIGEGGMGVVYMAEQASPVRRKVALKVIKLGMDTKQVIARFEAERQALAMMEHPHIARVLDAGTTESGRPYFVMELVRGVPIHTYCDTQKLTTAERLELFGAVCRAVQHAHQKGIIHRDLKPTNVLVTSHDGVPVPKIIDFGVAKATNQRLTERTLFTEFHQIVGTPEYMSPEQAEMSGLDVDTRSDIYSLGVLLYQLLTGTTPADSTALRTAAYDEMTRMIREDEAPTPSTRVSSLGEGAERIARDRGSDASALSRHLRGDLDWIVMRALEKDRTRRYETAVAFAEDIRRHLDDRPVEAGPPRTAYRIAKFVRRNRAAVGAGLVLAAILALGLAGTTAGFLRARSEAQRSRRISASLQDVLAMADPDRASDVQSVEALRTTVGEVFGADHATYAAVLDTLARRLYDAGEFEPATELANEALVAWEAAYGPGHPSVAAARSQLGQLLRAQGDASGAEAMLRAALQTSRPDAAPAQAPIAVRYQTALALADLLVNRGAYVEADTLFGELLGQLRSQSTPSRFRVLNVLEQRVLLRVNQPGGEVLPAISEFYEEAHAFYPDTSPMLAVVAMGYGTQLFDHGQREAAEPYLREAIERLEACDDPPRAYLLRTRDQLFQILRGRTDVLSQRESDELLRLLIDDGRSFWGPDELASNLHFYGNRLAERERWLAALDALTDAHQVLLDAERSVTQRESVRDNLTMISFGVSIRPGLEPDAYARARAAAERALLDEPEHPAMLHALAFALYRTGDIEGAGRVLARIAEPLRASRSGLARRMAPSDHALRALLAAQAGDGATASDELEVFRKALQERPSDRSASALLNEVERVVRALPGRR